MGKIEKVSGGDTFFNERKIVRKFTGKIQHFTRVFLPLRGVAPPVGKKPFSAGLKSAILNA